MKNRIVPDGRENLTIIYYNLKCNNLCQSE